MGFVIIYQGIIVILFLYRLRSSGNESKSAFATQDVIFSNKDLHDDVTSLTVWGQSQGFKTFNSLPHTTSRDLTFVRSMILKSASFCGTSLQQVIYKAWFIKFCTALNHKDIRREIINIFFSM